MDSVKQIAVESGETFPSEMSFGKDTMNCALIVYFSHSIVILFNPAVPPGLCVLLVAKSSYPPTPCAVFYHSDLCKRMEICFLGRVLRSFA